MKLFVFACLVVVVTCKSVTVSNSGQLSSALKSANPGDSIHLNDGTYKGSYEITRSGKSGSLITLTGGRGAVLEGSNYGLHLKANYWTLKGFSVANSHKGIVVEGGSHNILDDLEVKNIVQEGIHFRSNSADNILRNSYVHHTGQGSATDQGYGEGVYIGQAVSNWQGGPDKSDRNQILNNQIGPNVAAECVDIKEGSCCGVVQGNTFVGPESGQNYAVAWVNVKGDKYTVEDNTGSKPLQNGIEIHKIAAANMGGCDNVIQNNHCSGLPSGGKCANDASGGCNNKLSNNK